MLSYPENANRSLSSVRLIYQLNHGGHLFVQLVETQCFQDNIKMGCLACTFRLNTIEHTVYQYLHV